LTTWTAFERGISLTCNENPSHHDDDLRMSSVSKRPYRDLSYGGMAARLTTDSQREEDRVEGKSMIIIPKIVIVLF